MGLSCGQKQKNVHPPSTSTWMAVWIDYFGLQFHRFQLKTYSSQPTLSLPLIAGLDSFVGWCNGGVSRLSSTRTRASNPNLN